MIIVTKVKINAGICGFTTMVTAESEDMQMVNLTIRTGCPNYKPLESELVEVDGFTECLGKLGEGEIYETCKKYCPHPACPVPSGIVKAVEVACGLALPKDANFEISKQ